MAPTVGEEGGSEELSQLPSSGQTSPKPPGKPPCLRPGPAARRRGLPPFLPSRLPEYSPGGGLIQSVICRFLLLLAW